MTSPIADPMTGPIAPDTGAVLDVSHVIQSQAGLALRASSCVACGLPTFPASDICPFCLAEDAVALAVSGRATLYSFTRVHIAPKSWKTPYAVGYADFANGLRLLAKLSDAGPAWHVDQPVTLKVVPAGVSDSAGYRYYLEAESV
ncbi:OB-fold domain-containing protein [soil metagenome]